MPLPLSERNPSLIHQVDEAYEHALSASPDSTTKDLGAKGLSAIFDEADREARSTGIVGGLEDVANPETHAAFERAFALTTDIYSSPSPEWTNLTPPAPEDFAAQHPDLFTRLANVHERMEADNQLPEILITAHLGKAQTQALFASKTAVRDRKGTIIDDKGIPNNPLKHNDDGDGLWVNSDITPEIWQACDTPPNTPDSPTALITTPDGMTWSIAITSSKTTPDNLNMSHEQLTDSNTPLLTISQYTRLQLGLIQAGKSPVDDSHWSWLQGDTSGNADGSAPHGYWLSGCGQVCVSVDVVGHRNGALGSRSPVG